ncbi:MAG: DUF4342 domain-containing protein [Peptostreptococcaceae bacterium]
MNNVVTIEKMDAIIQRVPGTTYANAKQALLDSEGDVIQAIIELESKSSIGSKTKQAKKVVEDAFNKDGEELKEITDKAKEVLAKSSAIRIIVEKNGKVILNLPVAVGVAGVFLGPLVTFVGLSAAVLSKYELKIQNEDDGTVVNLGELSKEKINILVQMVMDVKDSIVENKKDNKDITDELIKEEDESNLDK